MTHTLHREETDKTHNDEFLLLVSPSFSCNEIGCAKKINTIIDIIFDVGVTNLGSYELKKNIKSGVGAKEIKKANIGKPKPIIRCVFDDKEKFKEVLFRIIEADFGLSICVTAKHSSLPAIFKEMNIEPHSFNISMGIYGSTDKLPDHDIRTLTTMCGHALVSPNLVQDMLKKIKNSEISAEEAGLELAKPCVCGIFNQVRATRALRKILPHYSVEKDHG